MIIPEKEYTEQYLINHDDLIDRRFEINNGYNNIIVENTFKYHESGSVRGVARFGLCSTPWFECRLYSGQILKLGEIVSLSSYARDVNTGLSSDVIHMGEFFLTKVERTNIPNIYNIRGEINIKSNNELPVSLKNIMLKDISYKNYGGKKLFTMGIYPLLKAIYGNYFYDESETTETQTPVIEDIEVTIATDVQSQYGGNIGDWSIVYDAYCEDFGRTGDKITLRGYTGHRRCYSFTMKPGSNYEEACSVINDLYKKKRTDVLANLRDLNPFVNWVENKYNNYNVINNISPIKNGEIIYLGGRAQHNYFPYYYYVAVPKKLQFRRKEDGLVTGIPLQITREVEVLMHGCLSLEGTGLSIDRNSTENVGGYDEYKFTLDFLNNINLKDKLNNSLEVEGYCSKIINNSTGSKITFFKLPNLYEYGHDTFPENQGLYPTNGIYPTKLSDKNRISSIGYNTCKDLFYGDAENVFDSVSFETQADDGSVTTLVMSKTGTYNNPYVLKDNTFFTDVKWEDIRRDSIINNGILKEIQKLRFFDFSVDTVANPLIQIWDRVEAIDPTTGNKIEGFVISRTMSGSQFMRDVMECKAEKYDTIEPFYTLYEEPDEEIPNDGPETSAPGGY